MAARQRGLHGGGLAGLRPARLRAATQLFEQSMALRRALGETEGETQLLFNAARQARAVGQYQRATALLEEALARHRAMGRIVAALSSGGLGLALYELGWCCREQGDFARAAALFEECWRSTATIGDRESDGLSAAGTWRCRARPGRCRRGARGTASQAWRSFANWACNGRSALRSIHWLWERIYEGDLTRALTLSQRKCRAVS